MVDRRAVGAGVRAPLSCSLGVFALVACTDPKPDCEPRAGVHEATLQADNDGDGQVISIDLDPAGTFRVEAAFRDIERDVEIDAVIEGTVRLCRLSGWDRDASTPCTAEMEGVWEGNKGEGDWHMTCRQIDEYGDYYDLPYRGTWATIP